jgi:microcystin-dependent protein
MNEVEQARVEDRMRRLEEALEALPRAAAGGGGWRVSPDSALAVADIKLRGAMADHTVNGREWLFCDGRAVSRSTYAALFAVTGTAFGVGDGSTTFNLPDLRRRFPIGALAGTLEVGANDNNQAGDRQGESYEPHSRIDAVANSVDVPHSHTVGIGTGRTYDALTGSYSTSGTSGFTAGTPDVGGVGIGAHGHNLPSLQHYHDVTIDSANANHGHSVSLTKVPTMFEPIDHQAVGFFILAKAE